MKYDISFIGAGNMGGALIRAVCRGIDPAQVLIYDAHPDTARAVADETGCAVAASAAECAESARFVMLCVKPQIAGAVLDGLVPAFRSGETVLVSIAAGVSIEAIRAILPSPIPVVRSMPNTPAMVGKGLLLVATGDTVTQGEYDALARILAPCGLVERVEERVLDLATPISGCGPAYAYLFIEALADGGVQIGLSRAQAQRYAAQTLLGAAAMVLETGTHPGALKDAVCSPGGSTIAGVAALEEHGFRGTVTGAVLAAHKRNGELGK